MAVYFGVAYQVEKQKFIRIYWRIVYKRTFHIFLAAILQKPNTKTRKIVFPVDYVVFIISHNRHARYFIIYERKM